MGTCVGVAFLPSLVLFFWFMIRWMYPQGQLERKSQTKRQFSTRKKRVATGVGPDDGRTACLLFFTQNGPEARGLCAALAEGSTTHAEGEVEGLDAA